MKSFAALMRLQLLSRYADLKPRNMKAQLAENKSKTVWRVIGVIVLLVYLGIFLVTVENAIMSAFIGMEMGDMLLHIAVMLGTLGTLVMSFFFVMSSLYFNRDAVMLAALPIRTRTLLSARITQVWLSETAVNALIVLPAGIIYGIRTGVDPLFYVRLAAVWLTLAILPIVAVSWLSTLLIRLSMIWKRRELIATISGIILLLAYMIFCMNMGAMVGDNGEATEMLTNLLISQQGRINAFFSFFPPMRWALRGLMGDTGMLLLFAAVSIMAAALTVILMSVFYRKLTLLQGETTSTEFRRAKGARIYSQTSAYRACCRREWLGVVRVPTYAVNTLPTAIMPVIMIVAMYIGFSRAGHLDMTRIVGDLHGFSGGIVVAVMAALMAYMMGINPAASSAVTREGRGHDCLTALPIPSETAVLAKLTVGYGISLFGALAGTILLIVLVPEFAVHALLAFVLCALYGFATTALALARDVRHPRLDWVTEQEAIKQQSGVLIGLLISWGLLVGLGLISFLLLWLKMNMYLYVLILTLILMIIAYFAYKKLMKAAKDFYAVQ